MTNSTTFGGNTLWVLAVGSTAVTILVVLWQWGPGEGELVEEQAATHAAQSGDSTSPEQNEPPRRSEGNEAPESSALPVLPTEFDTKVEQDRLLRRLQDSIDRLNGDPKALHLAAVTYAELLQTDEALRLFKRALEASDGDSEVATHYADLLL